MSSAVALERKTRVIQKLNNCYFLGAQFPLVSVAIRSFCWLLIRHLKLFLFVFCVPFQISNLPVACSGLSLSGRSWERRSLSPYIQCRVIYLSIGEFLCSEVILKV